MKSSTTHGSQQLLEESKFSDSLRRRSSKESAEIDPKNVIYSYHSSPIRSPDLQQQ